MRLLEDLLVCIPTRAARWSQNIQDGSQELQSRAGAPRRRVLQELVVSQHVGTQLAGQFLQRPGSPQVQGKAQLAFPYQLLKQGGPLGLVERLSLGLLTREAPKENGAMETGGEHWPSCPSTHRLQEVNILELQGDSRPHHLPEALELLVGEAERQLPIHLVQAGRLTQHASDLARVG